jgi:hypothetical protein
LQISSGIALLSMLLLLFAFRPGLSASARQYLQTAPGGILFKADFENGDRAGWKNLNNGRWDIFELAGNHVFGVRGQDPAAVPNAYLLASEDWTDYSFGSDVVFQSGTFEQIFLVVRSQRKENCTGYRVGGNRLGVSIFRFDPVNGCDGEVLAEDIHYPLIEGRAYRMRVDAVGSRIRYYIDERLILEAVDAVYPKGGLGFLAYQVKSAAFDNIAVVKKGAEK